MYGIFSYIYHKKSTLHVGKYTIYMDPVGNLLTAACSFKPLPLPLS